MWLNDSALRAAVVLTVLICALTVLLVGLTWGAERTALVAWFYFATVDYEQVWGFGPFSTFDACMVHREMTVPNTVEATACSLMNVVDEQEA